MSLKTSSIPLSLHSFLAAAWPDGKLINSPSSSYAKSLLEKWWCGSVFLFSCLCQVQQWKADSKAKHVHMSHAEPSNSDAEVRKSKCWVYISLLWVLVMRLLILSTAELMTGFCRVKFACFTVLWWLSFRTKVARIVVFSSNMAAPQHEQSTLVCLGDFSKQWVSAFDPGSCTGFSLFPCSIPGLRQEL